MRTVEDANKPVIITWNGEMIPEKDVIKRLPEGKARIKDYDKHRPLSWVFTESFLVIAIYLNSESWKWKYFKVFLKALKDVFMEYLRPTKLTYIGKQ